MLAVPGAALLLVAATLVLAGSAGEGPADDHVLVTDGAGTVSLVDTTAGTTLYSIEDAVAAPDATTVYRTKPEGEDTQIDQLDARDGSVVGSQVVPGELAIAVVSFDASAVALLPRYSIGYGLYEPVPREVTPITVIRNDGSEPRTYDLEGNFEPETFSKDLDTLFLIEFWPATEPDRYFVRQLDLDSGEMLVTYSPEVEWAPEMRGRARDHTMDPDGDYLYTLYSVQPGDPPIQDREDGTGGDNWAFVHVLDLREEQSICIFLGGDFAERSGDRLGMAIAPDGKTLYVVDSATGAIAEIDTGRHQVSAMIEVPELADAGYYATRPVVEASDDRLFVTQYTSSIWELDRHNNLAAVGVLGTDGSQIIGLDLSPAGNELRIAVPGQIIVYDLIADAEVATVTGPGSGGGTIDFTGAPPGIAGRYPLECAC
jgi:DNA-binding beta-propeller fold protein YncE